MRGAASFALALLSAAAPAPAQQPVSPPPAAEAAPSLDWMAGSWAGNGVHFGRPSKVRLALRPILGGKGYAMEYSVAVAGDARNAPIEFAAQALFRVAKGAQWDGRWLDSFGNLHDIAATLSSGAMISIWGSPATEIGWSSYRLEGGELLVTDKELSPKGSLNLFGESRLTRQ